MKKSDLLNYVGRYHLAGATTSVKWVAKDGKLETEFIKHGNQRCMKDLCLDTMSLNK